MPKKLNQLTLREKGDFFHLLKSLTKTGVSIPLVLEEQAKVTPPGAYRLLLHRTASGIKAGRSYGDTLRGNSFGLSNLDINLLETGEKTGHIPRVCQDLEKYYYEQDKARKKLISGVTGPAALFFAASLIAAVPALFNKSVTAFFIEAFTYIFALGMIIFGGYMTFKNLKRKAGHQREAGLRLYNLPLWGPVERNLDLYRFATILNLSISAGLGLPGSLKMTASGVDNYLLKDDIFKARRLIEKKGLTLDQAFSTSSALGHLVKRIMITGELTGTIDEQLSKLSDYLYEDLMHRITGLLKSIKIFSYSFAMMFILFRLVTLWGGVFSSLRGI